VAARALPARPGDWRCDLGPLTDGREGFAGILTRAAGGRFVDLPVSGPRVRLVPAGKLPAAVRVRLPLAEGATLAGLEMVSASGLALLPPDQRDPWPTTTPGTGQLIRAAAGAGAAGGIAFGLMAAARAQLLPGFDLVSDWFDLSRRLAEADLVITGEGRFDASSLAGKGPGSIVAEARRLGKPVHVFAGSLGVPASDPRHLITPAGLPLAEALPRTGELLAAVLARL